MEKISEERGFIAKMIKELSAGLLLSATLREKAFFFALLLKISVWQKLRFDEAKFFSNDSVRGLGSRDRNGSKSEGPFFGKKIARCVSGSQLFILESLLNKRAKISRFLAQNDVKRTQ